MTSPGELELAAAVDAAIPADLVAEWHQHVERRPLAVARQGIFSAEGAVVGYELSIRGLDDTPVAQWSSAHHERASAHVLRRACNPTAEDVTRGRLAFVRTPRAYLIGELSLPHRPDRLVLELPPDLQVDTELLAGLNALRQDGFRLALTSFSDRPSQRRLLPMVDFVKIDVRDLDVEGLPVVRIARSHGAALVGEFVEHPDGLSFARDLGITLFQGNLLERAGIVAAATVPPATR